MNSIGGWRGLFRLLIVTWIPGAIWSLAVRGMLHNPEDLWSNIVIASVGGLFYFAILIRSVEPQPERPRA